MKIFWLVYFLLFASTSLAHSLKVGSSQEVISPTPEEAELSCIAGYAPFSRCNIGQVSDTLFAKSLYISNHKKHVLFIVLDAIGVGDSIVHEVRANLEHRTKGFLKTHHIFVMATHTHSGPDLQGPWGGVSEQYRDRIIRRATSSALRAVRTSVAAKARISVTKAPVINRRGLAKVEDEVFVVDFVSSYLKTRIATLVNMSAHPTVLRPDHFAYSADYVGHLRLALDKALGGTSIFVNGVVGDMQPKIPANETNIEAAKKFGVRVAEKVIDNLKHHSKPLGSTLKFQTQSFKHPVTNPSILAASSAGLLDLDVSAEGEVDVEYTLMSLGKSKIVLVPGEVLSGTVAPVKNTLNSPYEMTFGLANGSLGYFIPSTQFGAVPNRNTEESTSLSALIGDELTRGLLKLVGENSDKQAKTRETPDTGKIRSLPTMAH